MNQKISRKFSLDSSVSQDATGRINGRRASTHKFVRRYKTNLEDSEQDIQELNQNSNGNITAREKTAVEDSGDRLDGVVSRNSFLKHNKTFHKLFPEIPEGENLTHTFVCSLQKEVPYHGKLFISENHVCFFSSVLLKETKVVIPRSNIHEVKKQNSALHMLSIQTFNDEKYFFISLRSREMCYNLLQNVQGSSAKSSLHGSSAENEADSYMCSSHSSIDDSVDHGMNRQKSSSVFEHIPQSASNGPTKSTPSSEEADHSMSSSWRRRLTEDVTAFFFLRQRVNFGIVFYVYLLVLLLLLFVSGYIGLRMIALEKQLNSLSELSLHYEYHQET